MLYTRVINLSCKQLSRFSSRFLSNIVTEVNNLEKTVNQVNLLGRVGADPQKRGTENHPVVIFSMATHINYKVESGDMVQRTDWHRICVFKPYLKDTVYENLRKGQRVLVYGRLSYGAIKDDDGKEKYTTAIIADDIIFFKVQKNEI